MRHSTRRLLLAAAATLGLMGAIPAASAAEELRILAWQGYADDDWVAEFEKETGANVSVVYAQTDDEIWSKIKGSRGRGFRPVRGQYLGAAALYRRRSGGTATTLPSSPTSSIPCRNSGTCPRSAVSAVTARSTASRSRSIRSA